MKQLTALCIALLLYSSGYAQKNTNEAKAAYLLAEESYGKGDYKGALDFLQQVRTSLGSANCKILYLQVMTVRELYAKDSSGAEKTLAVINEFEKASDYASFNEEKVLEITKLKLALKAEAKAIKDKRDTEVAAKAALDKAFNDEFNALGPWGLSMEELDSALPALKVKEWKQVEKYTTYMAPGVVFDRKWAARTGSYIRQEDTTSYKGKIMSVSFLKDKVYRYQTFLIYYDGKEDGGDQYLEAYNLFYQYGKKLGLEPTFSAEGDLLKHTWVHDNKVITLELIYRAGKKTVVGPVQLIKSVYHL